MGVSEIRQRANFLLNEIHELIELRLELIKSADT
jgi:hypothetical protein